MRYIKAEILKTLSKKKMAFVAGPRQVGKTTLGQHLLAEASCQSGYFNWDIEPTRKEIIRDPVHFWKKTEGNPAPRILLDEIHKYPRWKRFLKGFHDANRGSLDVLVTGSGRLDIYQRGGDSLFGRYHLYHLLPFSVGELARKEAAPPGPEEFLEQLFKTGRPSAKTEFDRLFDFNGFPEPLFAADRRALVQWQSDHRQLILREELRDLTQIRELGLVESLMTLLPQRVGSPLSINALREDLNVNFKTVQNWLSALERLYFVFTLRPFSGRLARTLRREEKLYFYDWSVLEDQGKKLENFVAAHLLKASLYWSEAGYGDFRLQYVRDKEKREVDFLIVNKTKPFLLVEVKSAGRQIDPALTYFHERLKPRYGFQLTHESAPSALVEMNHDLFLCSLIRFLSALP